MAVSFYHVLGYKVPECGSSIEDPDHAPCYMGKTTDMLLKEEPEKTVDCDDGSTMVGSAKVTLSFSLLERVPAGLELDRILLVPDFPAIAAGSVTDYGEAILVDVEEVKIWPVESKTGEFERTQFSAVSRYPIEAEPPYTYIPKFFQERQVHLIRGWHVAESVNIAYWTGVTKVDTLPHYAPVQTDRRGVVLSPDTFGVTLEEATEIKATIPQGMRGVFVHDFS